MDKREIRRKLRKSNVLDLLDDGIENGSDLKTPAHKSESIEPHRTSGTTSSTIPNPSDLIQSPLGNAGPANGAPDRQRMSYGGFVLGLGSIAAGCSIFPMAHSVNIYHARARYRPFIEHLTASESRLYACAAIVFGIVVCAYSIYRPRR